MKIIGLTGGIASGKSSVSRHLKALGYTVIDCDALARRVVEPGRPAYRALVHEFGTDILLQEGSPPYPIHRKQLGAIVFQDEFKRVRLNAITHPAIRREILDEIVKAWFHGKEMVFVDAPLLIESGLHRFMTEVIVVYCPEMQQLQRLMNRDGFTESEAKSRIQAQASMKEKLRLATRVLDNSDSLESLFEQVNQLVPRLRPSKLRYWFWRLGPPGLFLALVGPLLVGLSHLGYDWMLSTFQK